MFVLISKYGFADLLGQDDIALDPSRVAAQIVSPTPRAADAARALHRRRGILRTVLERCTGAGFAVARVSVQRETIADDGTRVAALTLLCGGLG